MKRLASKLMALGMVAVVVTGCSTNSTTSTTTQNTTKSEAPQAEVKEETKEANDAGQAETDTAIANLPFPEYRNENGEIDLKGEKVKLLWSIPESRNGWVDYFKETYNGEIEVHFADWGDVVEKLTAGVASGDPADITYIYPSWYPEHVTAKLLEPIDEYLPLAESLRKEDDTSYFSQGYMDFYKWRGQNYVFSTDQSAVKMIFHYNKRMLDEAGLEYPYELEKRGEWTWDKMLEYAELLTVDKDGDGEIDQYGITGNWGGIFMAGNDVDMVTLPREADDPAPKLNFDDPIVMKGLLLQEKVLNGGWSGGVVSEGTAAMGFDGAQHAKDDTANLTLEGWGFCGPPIGPDNTTGKITGMHADGWAIVKGSKNPVGATVAIHSMLNRPEGKSTIVDPEALPFSGFGSQEEYDRMISYNQNVRLDGTGGTILWVPFDLGIKPLATAIEEATPLLKEKIKQTTREDCQ